MNHMTTLDRERLLQALSLAETAIGVCDPNPRVGCVVGRDDGSILGRGATQAVGGPHAEVVALGDARALGHELRGATAWVTLEPCAHHGRTPPCCDALIAAGIARAVVAIQDPFPKVAGEGIARMRAAGITVDLADADIAEAAREINIGFFTRIQRGRPWVRLKIAASLDGRTALCNGVSQWITGPAARADGHGWRKRAGAILTGIGTVTTDDPRLDVRLVETVNQPLRVVCDSRAKTPLSARLLKPPGQVLIASVDPQPEREAALRAAGAEIIRVPSAAGAVDLHWLMTELARRDINELHVEAGAHLNASLLEAALVDELLVYLAPVVIGLGQGMSSAGPAETLRQIRRFRFHEMRLVGDDMRVRARPIASAEPAATVAIDDHDARQSLRECDLPPTKVSDPFTVAAHSAPDHR